MKHDQLNNFTFITGCSSSLVKNLLTCTNPLSKNSSSCHCSNCPGFFSGGWGGITVYTSGAAAAASEDTHDNVMTFNYQVVDTSLVRDCVQKCTCYIQ